MTQQPTETPREVLLRLAERCDKAALGKVSYALSPPQGYGGMGAAERHAVFEWLAIADALRARASTLPGETL